MCRCGWLCAALRTSQVTEHISRLIPLCCSPHLHSFMVVHPCLTCLLSPLASASCLVSFPIGFSARPLRHDPAPDTESVLSSALWPFSRSSRCYLCNNRHRFARYSTRYIAFPDIVWRSLGSYFALLKLLFFLYNTILWHCSLIFHLYNHVSLPVCHSICLCLSAIPVVSL